MKIIKSWTNFKVTEGEAAVEYELNYVDKTFYIIEEHEESPNFKTDEATSEEMKFMMDKAKCIMAALKHIKSELNL